MKQRIGWIVLVVVVVVAIGLVVRWWPDASRARLDKEMARLTAIVELVRSRPLDSARLKKAAETISDAADDLRGPKGVVAIGDSLAKTELPQELTVRLMGAT